MPFTAECPFCRTKLQGVPNNRAGASVECPRCHSLFTLAAMVNPPRLQTSPLKEAALATPPPAPAAAENPAAQAVGVGMIESTAKPVQQTRPTQPHRSRSATPPANHDDQPAPSLWAVNRLGVTSFLLGSLALPVALLPWVSVLAIPMSGLGLLLGLLGALVTAPKKGGLAYAIAGLVVCLPMVVVLVPWSGLGGLFTFGWNRGEQDSGGIVVHLPRQGRGWHVAVKEREWADASKGSLRRDDVRVQVTSVAVKPADVKEPRKNRPATEECLVITLRITNAGDRRTINYASWGEPGNKGNLSLLDNLGKVYRRKTLASGPELGHIRSASIDPRKEAEDVLVFEAPPPDIAFLSLELPGSAVGISGGFRLEIPRQMISYR